MSTAATQTAAQRFDIQKKRYDTVKQRQTRVQVELESAKRQLDEAKREAKEQFGTDNLDELRELYKTRERDNDQKVVDLTLDLDQVESRLADIEQTLK